MPITGAGNPAGSGGTSGVGTGLSFIGNHAFGYSGIVTVNNNETALLKADVGNLYIKGIIMPLGITITTSDYKFQVKINGEVVGQYTLDSGNNRDNFHQLMHIIIPANSSFEVLLNNATGSNDIDGAVMLTGRVYR